VTALALALVACCAMVCGTVIAWRFADFRDNEKRLMRLEIDALKRAGLGMTGDISRLQSEVASLRADMAVRSIA
jgi:hypothetical protein